MFCVSALWVVCLGLMSGLFSDTVPKEAMALGDERLEGTVTLGDEWLVEAVALVDEQLKERVMLGDERFEEFVPLLTGKRVAVFSNHSGIVGDVVTRGLAGGDAVTRGLAGGDAVTRGLAGGDAVALGLAGGDAVTRGLAGGDVVTRGPAGGDAVTRGLAGGDVEYGQHLVDALLERGVDVRLIFSPEHGFRGDADAGEGVEGGRDEKTGIRIVSLYGQGAKAAPEKNQGVFDVLVVDIQDVGLRYYTYYITLSRLMEVCARHGKEVIVLDRPNPNGFYVDGPVLEPGFTSGVGRFPMPTVHGMTLGELAMMAVPSVWPVKPTTSACPGLPKMTICPPTRSISSYP